MSYPFELYEILSRLRSCVPADAEGKWTARESQCTITFSDCRVDEEWLSRIEQGMDFVGKAIDEERRFIRVNGEVVPIEKVRRVSKESIRHLARHSELISRPQEDDVIPDKLYTVERLNDYATYENRFLYRLLVTAKEFLYKRRAAIAKALGSYGGSMNARFTLGPSEKSLTFTMKLEDTRNGDDYLTQSSEVFRRLEKLIRTVDFYLATPLMTELAKEAVISAAITKNNVLKMDKNFKQAVELYDFLATYEQDGFEIEEKTIAPDLSADAGRIALLAVLSVYGNTPRVAEWLKGQSEREAADRLALLKERMDSDPEGYVLELERRNARLKQAEEQAEVLLRKVHELEAQRERSEAILAGTERDWESDKKRYEEIIADYSLRLKESLALCEEQRERHRQFAEQSEREILVLKSQMTALTGMAEEDVTFEELERRYEALGALINGEWPNVKRQLRKEARKQLKQQLFGKNKKGAEE